MTGTVLILGASGNFGRNAARAFAGAGWQVRRWQRGSDMGGAAQGADLIVNALNPPDYHNWDKLIPQITADVIAAARTSGATALIPGNVYPYGRQPGPWGPDTPHRPSARKGAIRARMEAEYRAATEGGLRVIVLRGGDFIDPDSATTVMSMLILKHVAKGQVQSLGSPEVRRAYAYLPDMARAAVALAERRADLPAYADIPFDGHSFSTTELADLVAGLTGRPTRITRFPWWFMRLAAPFWELARELLEMRYLFETPHALAPEPLRRWLPDFRETPLDAILARHLGAAMPEMAPAH